MRFPLLMPGAALALAACANEDSQVANTFDPDTATPAVDTGPATVASGVAVLLTGENILALLDTAYAAAAEAARLARQKSQSDEVRAFAEQAVARHTSARLELAQVAQQHSISPLLPEDDLLGEQREAMEELRRLTGADFDRAFVERSLRTHQELLDQVDDARENARNSDIAEFLDAQRTKLTTELEALRALASSGPPTPGR